MIHLISISNMNWSQGVSAASTHDYDLPIKTNSDNVALLLCPYWCLGFWSLKWFEVGVFLHLIASRRKTNTDFDLERMLMCAIKRSQEGHSIMILHVVDSWRPTLATLSTDTSAFELKSCPGIHPTIQFTPISVKIIHLSLHCPFDQHDSVRCIIQANKTCSSG